jgi:hypothetical protein
MFNLRIRSLLFVLGGVVCAGFAGSVGVQQFASSQMAINSQAYGQIVRAKDLVADVLPPPAYLIESFLEATLAKNSPQSAANHKQRLAKLKEEYNARHTFWSDKSGWPDNASASRGLPSSRRSTTHATPSGRTSPAGRITRAPMRSSTISSPSNPMLKQRPSGPPSSSA